MNDMTDQEKSVLLAKAMGADWKYFHNDEIDEWLILDSENVVIGYGNLYDPANMALAWRVLNWAHKQFPGHGINPITKMYQGFHEAVFLPADKVIEVWLDETINILVEAEIITPEAKSDQPRR